MAGPTATLNSAVPAATSETVWVPAATGETVWVPAATGETVWAPRLKQQARLTELDGLLTTVRADDGTISLAIERALLLAALDRPDDARMAFINLLRVAPTHFAGLNEFGGLLTRLGSSEAASRVYAEAVRHHPHNPMGHVNLANLAYRASRFEDARAHYETALRIDPEHQGAHQGLGAVLSDLGEHAAARQHFAKGFHGCAITTLPYRGTRPPVELLHLISSGGGNIPTQSFIDDHTFLTTMVVTDHVDPATPLPPHRLVFNAIGDADICQPALAAAIALVARTSAPVINDPRKIVNTGRAETSRRLHGLPGVITPRVVMLPRSALDTATAADTLAAEGFGFPLLLRSPGYHTGRNFIRVETPDAVTAAVAALPGDDLLAIEYLDARGADGQSRKYRAMFINGTVYPLHLAISRQWKVHYFTADMAERADHRAEEAIYLDDMQAVLGARAVAALHRIRDELGLDYGGIDFGLGPSGDVLLFETNATMVVYPPDADERWTYRRAAVQRVLDAATGMVLDRARGPVAT